MAEAIEILKALGITESEIEKDDLDVEAFAESFRTRQRELFKNDPEFTKEIVGPERAKLQATYERKVKQQFDLSADEIKDKNFEQMLELAKEKSSKTKSANTDEIQKELIEANKKLKQYEEEILPAKDKEVEEKVKQYRINEALTKKVASLPLSVDPEAALIIFKDHLTRSNALDIDENGELVILNKDGSKVADKNKFFTTDEILETTASRFKIKKESNAGESGGTPPKPPVTNTNTSNAGASTHKNPHLRAAEEAARLKREKAEQQAA